MNIYFTFTAYFLLLFYYYRIFYIIPYRAEQQRNQALENAEKLKEAFKDYKATFSCKLKKVTFLNMDN